MGKKMCEMLILCVDPVLWAAPTAPTPHPSLQSNQDPFPDRHPRASSPLTASGPQGFLS